MFVMRCFNPFNFSSLVSLHKQAGRGGKGEKQKKKGKRERSLYSEARVSLSSSLTLSYRIQFG